MLKRLGYRVDVVANGREAVHAVESVPSAAVLMDCQMPEMNGYEATEGIRRREGSGRRVPIVALTASAIKGDEERCLAAGMDAYVTKPVTVDALGTVLRQLVAGDRAGSRTEILDHDVLDSLRQLSEESPGLLEELTEVFIDDVPSRSPRCVGRWPGRIFRRRPGPHTSSRACRGGRLPLSTYGRIGRPPRRRPAPRGHLSAGGLRLRGRGSRGLDPALRALLAPARKPVVLGMDSAPRAERTGLWERCRG